MKIPTKRFDKKLPLPKYEKGAAGFDFIIRENATIKPKETQALKSNLAMEIPEGYFLMIIPRSSTALRTGLTMPNSVGVIDSFYNGSENEMHLLFYNSTGKDVKVKKGDKLAQGIIFKYEIAEFDETRKLKRSKRSVWKIPKKRK
jgi:dUTP pyrophosphatase